METVILGKYAVFCRPVPMNQNPLLTTDVLVLRESSVDSGSIVQISTTGRFQFFRVTPTSTGKYFLVRNTGGLEEVIGSFICVAVDDSARLADVWNSAIGNWNWNKKTNVMTLSDPSGKVFATFAMTADDLQASRTVLATGTVV